MSTRKKFWNTARSFGRHGFHTSTEIADEAAKELRTQYGKTINNKDQEKQAGESTQDQKSDENR